MIGADQGEALLVVQLIPVHLAEGLEDFLGHCLVHRGIGWLAVGGVDARHLGQPEEQGDPLAVIIFLQGAVGPLLHGLMLYRGKGGPAHEAVAVVEVRPCCFKCLGIRSLVERLQFLTEQSEDLQKAVDDLKHTIRDINVESRRRFREMFDQVNEHFGEVFTKLFGGGEAQMVLTESEDLLDAGIDIVAQPPGKKLQHINLLSGGEKALTALSLIFAIFLIKPSPFCLLDEVDAPLDDANVGRFTNLIRQLADGSQFIIITHNKKTMELGDRLYGVTMEEPGISKTVSVHFQEAERMVA